MSDLFDSHAQEAKDAAIQQVAENAQSAWLEQARRTTLRIAKAHPQGFTSDAVWFVLSACGYGHPTEPRAMGAVFHALARNGLIRKTGEYRDSERAECHGRPIAVWRLAVSLDSEAARL